MRNHAPIIVDLTGANVLVGVTSQDANRVKVIEGFAPSFRVAIRRVDREVLMCADAGQSKAPFDSGALVFGHLHQCLPLIGDEELQTRLIEAFWRYLAKAIDARKLLDSSDEATSYVIVPYNWPALLVDRFRDACAENSQLAPAGFPNEAASLVIGALGSAMARALSPSPASAPITVCLTAAYSDKHADVCCFDYLIADGNERRVFIRDFFRTSFADLRSVLYSREWFKPLLSVVSLESSLLSEVSQASLTEALEGLSLSRLRDKGPSDDVLDLKLRGAEYLARASKGGALSMRYDVATALNIGLQTNATSFQPVLTQSDIGAATRFPISSTRAFRFSAKPTGDLKLSARYGYSTLVEESTAIGDFTIGRDLLGEIFRNKQAALSAVVRLDLPGSGEFLLEMRPTGRVIGSRSFILPGMMT